MNTKFAFKEKTAGSLVANKEIIGYLIECFDKIKSEASPKLSIAYELHKSKASSLNIFPFIISYDKLYNLLLTIKPSNGFTSDKYLLISCHYDTPPGSYGASDDFISCAIMLEVARILSSGHYNLKVNLLFVFDGAEEALLPGSHAFITQHPIATNISAFINLEGAGSGGRSVLFRSSPNNISNVLLESFSRTVASPQADIFAEELFQSGLVPGETDFRIYYEVGKLPGLDFAHVQDGYCYHTLHDVPNRISDNCIQLTGNNLIHIIADLASTDLLNHLPRVGEEVTRGSKKILMTPGELFKNLTSKIFPAGKDTDHYVYFDIFASVMIRFPLKYLIAFNLLLAFAVLAMVTWRRTNVSNHLYRGTFSGLFIAFLFQMFTLTLNVVLLLGLSYFHVRIDLILSWFSTQLNLVPLYLCPLIAFQCLCYSLLKSALPKVWRLSDKRAVNYFNLYRDFTDASLVLFVLLMLSMTLFKLASSHIFTIWVLLMTLVELLLILLTNSLVVKMIFMVLPYGATDYVMHMSILFKVFIPITGRSGHSMAGEFILPIIIFFAILPYLITLSSFLITTQRKTLMRMFKLCLFIYVSSVICLRLTDFGFPYTSISNEEDVLTGISPTRQQRIFIFHMDRDLHEDWTAPERITSHESRLVLTTFDANKYRYLNVTSRNRLFSPPFNQNKSDLSQTQASLESCDFNLPYCGISYYYAFTFAAGDNCQVANFPRHNSEPKANVRVISRDLTQRDNETSLVNVTLTITSGPPHTHVYLRTERPFVTIYKISLDPAQEYPKPIKMPHRNKTLADGDHFFISHLNGEATSSDSGPHSASHPVSSWTFWVQFQVLNNNTDPSLFRQHTFDIALAGHYFDLPHHRRDAMNDFIQKHIPDWFIVTSYPTGYFMKRFSLLY